MGYRLARYAQKVLKISTLDEPIMELKNRAIKIQLLLSAMVAKHFL